MISNRQTRGCAVAMASLCRREIFRAGRAANKRSRIPTTYLPVLAPRNFRPGLPCPAFPSSTTCVDPWITTRIPRMRFSPEPAGPQLDPYRYFTGDTWRKIVKSSLIWRNGKPRNLPGRELYSGPSLRSMAGSASLQKSARHVKMDRPNSLQSYATNPMRLASATGVRRGERATRITSPLGTSGNFRRKFSDSSPPGR